MSPFPRFALTAPVSTQGLAVIEGAELHHLRNVMRLRAGAAIALLAPDQTEYAGWIETINGSRAIVRISSGSRAIDHNPFPARLILAAAIIKGPRMDFLVEKAAELGAAELWPILCARSVAHAPGTQRMQRWRRLALAGAKQSLASASITIREPIGFADLIRALPDETLGLICVAGAEPLTGVIRRERPRAIMLACGPEGDFDSAELALAKENGLVAAGLGPNRLRTETAALAAVSLAAGMLDELRGGV